MATPSSKELQHSLDQAFDLVERDATTGLSAGPAGDPPHEAAPTAPSLPPPLPPLNESSGDADASPSKIPLVLGVLLVMVGFGLAAAPTLGLSKTVLAQLAGLGLSPALPFFTGILLTGLAWAQLNSGSRSGPFDTAVADRLEALQERLHQLAADSFSASNSEAESFEAMEEFVAQMSKYEGMIANLTKAVRMHNKPLTDLVSMATDQANRLSETDKALLAIKLDLEAIEKALGESLTSGEKKFEGMFERLHGSENELESSLAKNREILAERIGGDIEAQWDLLREQIEAKLEKLDSATREHIQRLGSRLDSLQSAAKAAPAPAPAPAAPPSPAPQQAPAPAPAAASPKPSSTPPAGGDSKDGGGKVLSAIERLKKMRGG